MKAVRVAQFLAAAALATTITLPWVPLAKADTGGVPDTIGAVVPHVTVSPGVVLSSVACHPQQWVQIPDGLTSAAAAAYANDPTNQHTVACAQPTTLVAQAPATTDQTDVATRLNHAQAAYVSALAGGADVVSALTAAKTTYAQPAAATATAGPDTIHPLACANGNFTDQGNDTVLNDSQGVQGHIHWILNYSDSAGCFHNFKTTDYSFVDGGNIWWGWMDIYYNGGGSAGLKSGSDGNAVTIPTRQSFPNINVTSGGLNLVTKYCTQTNPFNSCISSGFIHPGDAITH